jgi:hypothetical protein
MTFHEPDTIPHPSYFQIPQVEAGWSKEHLNKQTKIAFEEIQF